MKLDPGSWLSLPPARRYPGHGGGGLVVNTSTWQTGYEVGEGLYIAGKILHCPLRLW